jgi:hypothetical protein
MVGLGPTIHEFSMGQSELVAGKLVDGRAEHDHDGTVMSVYGVTVGRRIGRRQFFDLFPRRHFDPAAWNH